jgi:LacI family transcriptional regulator, galactose operon repressor
MANRPTLNDVAREAGLSVATVNRVVAGAEGVREDTALRVMEAAGRVGYHARNLIAQHAQATGVTLRLGILLHKERQAFYQTFAAAFRNAGARFTKARVETKILFSESQSPRDVAAQLTSFIGQVDVVAATAVNHHATEEAVQKLAAAGVPCFSLLSDFAQSVRKSYFGLNNMKVGRGAAKMLSVAARRPGKIALFVGGNRWHGHELREMGFRVQLRETGEQFELLDTLVNLETRQLTYEATLDLLSRHPELTGLYLAGGGMEGAIAALREEVAPDCIALVVNEHTPESHRAMADGYVSTIIGTPLDALCSQVIEAALSLKLGRKDQPGGQVFFDPLLYLPEFF